MQSMLSAIFRAAVIIGLLLQANLVFSGDSQVSALRRVSFPVADPQPALIFYRDLLGFRVAYDKTVTDPEQLGLLGPAFTRARVIHLEAPGLGAVEGGSMSLVQAWTEQGLQQPKASGGVALLFRIADVRHLYNKLVAAEVPVVSAPAQYAESKGATQAITVRDPLGNRVSFAQIPGDATAGGLPVLMRWMTGDFDNRRQFANQERREPQVFSRLGLQRRQVAVPALGDHVIYAQMNHDADPAKIYRQSFVVFHVDETSAVIRSENWSFADPQGQQNILSRLDDLKKMSREDFKRSLADNCVATWEARGEEFYTQISAQDCVITGRRTGEPLGIQATEFVGADGIRNEESGYKADGVMTFGLAPNQYYEFDRTR